jgi:hypothetical protein
MRVLLLLLLLPYNLDGLSCVANGKYQGSINDYGKNQFTEELDKLAQRTVNNTRIERCHITITLDYTQRKFIIQYHGNNITDKVPVTMSLQTKFQFSYGSSEVNNTFTYVCSSDDYCDLNYIKNWSQWLFIIDFSQLKNQLNDILRSCDNNDYNSSMCYDTNKVKQCPSHICRAVHMNNGTTTQCVEKGQIPESISLLISSKLKEKLELLGSLKPAELLEFLEEAKLCGLVQQFGLAVIQQVLTSPLAAVILGSLISTLPLDRILSEMKPSIVIIETTVITPNFLNESNSDQEKHQLSHTISYFCSFNQCNSPPIYTMIFDQIEKDFNVTGMLDFLSPNNTTSLINSTTSGGSRGGAGGAIAPSFEIYICSTLVLFFLFLRSFE